ncbi:MAG: MlaD family protein [Spirochaetia bacterium]|nr:MlaD family protein [Spirochaetia bacterium]
MPFTFNDRQKSVAFFLLTGVFFLLVLAVLIIEGSDLIAFKQSHYTLFNDGHGFTGGTAIKYKGFNIGKVKSMTLTKDNQIRADIYVYNKYRYLMKTDSVVRIQSSLLGASNLVLVTNSDPDATLLKPQSLVYSSDMPEGQDILTRFAITSKATDELTDKIKLILDDVHTLKPALESTLNNISKTMDSTNAIISGLRGNQRTAASDKILVALANTAEITGNIRLVTERLNSKDNSIGYILNDSKSLSAKIEKIMTNMDSVTENLKQFSDNNLGNRKEVDKVIALLKINLIELQNLLLSMQNVFGKPKQN